MEKIEQDCRRCYGRKIVNGEPCYECHGKGKIEITPEQLEEHFREYREKKD